MYLNAKHFFFFAVLFPLFPLFTYFLSPTLPTLAVLSTREPSPTNDQWICLKFENCSARRETVIRKAFAKAISMASISQNIDFDSDPAAIDFFGPSSLNYEYQDQIKSIFAHIATFRIGCNPGVRADIECVDCSSNRSETVAYVKNIQHPGPYPDGNRLSKTSPIFKFCERFFRDYKSPEVRLKEILDFDRDDWRPDLGSYTNQASLVLHEIMHADALVSAQNGNRRISDIEIKVDNGSGHEEYSGVYGAALCKTLARTAPERPNAKTALVRDGITSNADNYAQFALAKWVQTKFNGRYPHLPTDSRVAVDGSWRIISHSLKTKNSPLHGSAASDNIDKQHDGSCADKELISFTVPDYLPKCPNTIAVAEYMTDAAQWEAHTTREDF